VEGEDRTQGALLPEHLDDYVGAENPVRVVDVFVEQLDLRKLGFEGVDPLATGRPAYHPAVLLKIYIYGYLNRIQSSRRLEREAGRNLELIWLTGRLAPDFKTIADFRKDNGAAIRQVCSQFILLCRQLKLFAAAMVAIDGSKFKAVNNRDRNFTANKIERRRQQIEESIGRYLSAMDTADRAQPEIAEAKTARLKDKIAILKQQMEKLREIETKLQETPDKQISLTDPDARSMATRGRGSGMVGYNVQTAVDTTHHLIVAHEVTNVGHDRDQLAKMARQAVAAIDTKDLTVVADRGYFSGEEILACDNAGMTTFVPKPMTSNAKAEGRFGKDDFIFDATTNAYRCPAGQSLIWRF
jgi:transposase